MVLAIDSSDKISAELFEQFKQLISNVLSLYKLSPSNNKVTLVSIGGDNPKVVTPYAQTIASLQLAIEDLPRIGGKADYVKALTSVVTSLGTYDDVTPSHVILVTSWNQTSSVSRDSKYLADNLMQKSITLNVINVVESKQQYQDGSIIDDIIIKVIGSGAIPSIIPLVEKSSVETIGKNTWQLCVCCFLL